jgi:RNA polymerase sigma factor (TIGR02999 family)
MTTASTNQVNELLAIASTGDLTAIAKIAPLVYEELRAIADRALRGERRNPTVDTTSLVHEAYLKLVDQKRAHWRHRAQFLAVVAQIMRRILVDRARARVAAKRGGGWDRVTLEDCTLRAGSGPLDLVELDDALGRLGEFDPQQGRIVELRFFAGLSIRETAEVLGISAATVKRDWTLARAWLRRELG